MLWSHNGTLYSSEKEQCTITMWITLTNSASQNFSHKEFIPCNSTYVTLNNGQKGSILLSVRIGVKVRDGSEGGF